MDCPRCQARMKTSCQVQVSPTNVEDWILQIQTQLSECPQCSAVVVMKFPAYYQTRSSTNDDLSSLWLSDVKEGGRCRCLCNGILRMPMRSWNQGSARLVSLPHRPDVTAFFGTFGEGATVKGGDPTISSGEGACKYPSPFFLLLGRHWRLQAVYTFPAMPPLKREK